MLTGPLCVVLLVLLLLLALVVVRDGATAGAIVAGGAQLFLAPRSPLFLAPRSPLSHSGGESSPDAPITLADLLDDDAIPDPAAAEIVQPHKNGDFVVDKDGGSPSDAEKPWWKYESWNALAKDKAAVAEYTKARLEAIKRPGFDWGPVLKVVSPLLDADCEYVGIVNVEADGRTLRLEAYEASPAKVEVRRSRTGGDVVAYVPAWLMAKYSDRPAMFIFHTHPNHPNGDPKPSPVDVVGSIVRASMARFAADVVISNHGVFMYGMTGPGYSRVLESAQPRLALRHHLYDVAAALESTRSWMPYTLADYVALFQRYELFMYVAPSPDYVAHTGYSVRYHTNIESNSDFDLLQHEKKAILRIHENEKKRKGVKR
jgi:hypothetical protein